MQKEIPLQQYFLDGISDLHEDDCVRLAELRLKENPIHRQRTYNVRHVVDGGAVTAAGER